MSEDIIWSPSTEKVLREYLLRVAEAAIGSAARKAQEILRDNIDRYTYRYDYFPNKRYEGGTGIPSFEFPTAFQLSIVKKTARRVSQELYYNWQSMSINEETNRHYGSERFGDSREILARILDSKGAYLWGREDRKKRQPFWKLTMKELIQDGVLEKIFTKELSKSGFMKVSGDFSAGL